MGIVSLSGAFASDLAIVEWGSSLDSTFFPGQKRANAFSGRSGMECSIEANCGSPTTGDTIANDFIQLILKPKVPITVEVEMVAKAQLAVGSLSSLDSQVANFEISCFTANLARNIAMVGFGAWNAVLDTARNVIMCKEETSRRKFILPAGVIAWAKLNFPNSANCTYSNGNLWNILCKITRLDDLGMAQGAGL